MLVCIPYHSFAVNLLLTNFPGPRICLGQQARCHLRPSSTNIALTPPRPQFALNEASFFLVRLLQNFTGFALAPDAQPEATRPPAHWKNAKGTQATEKIMLGRHLTMFAKVCFV
jgi:hypothetical protein